MQYINVILLCLDYAMIRHVSLSIWSVYTKFEYPRPYGSCYILPTRIVDDTSDVRLDVQMYDAIP